MPNTSEKKFFSTGELAKLCGVTVRTLQYYDQKGLLRPAGRSEGGRRLYDDAALTRLRAICLLKSLGLSLKGIRGVLEDPKDTAALLCLLHEQEKTLTNDIERNRSMLTAVRGTIANIQRTNIAQREIDNGMEHEMDTGAVKNTKQAAKRDSKLCRTKHIMIAEGIIVDIVEIVTLIAGIMTGNWVPLLCTVPLIAIICMELCRMYWRDARYVCPRCHATFQPSMWEMFWASHTPKTRKLTCPACGKKDWCAEVSTTT